MEEQLTNYIKEKYNPLAIVLHGSRANGYAKEHSDWDFLIFTYKDVNPARDIKFGANFEIKQVILPLSDNKIKEGLGFLFRTENIKILYDKDSIVPALLTKNEIVIEKGDTFNEVDKRARCAFLKSSLDSIEDYKNNELIVFSKKAIFYNKVVPTWFRFLHNEFKPSDYLALPRIKSDDPEFYKLLEEFIDADAEQSILIGNKMINHIFSDLD
ncbi:MAG: nucleotidyltransferase domain-containing protein [Patescibacteria group bacterium]|nr:nucleotidyltransferase domain-containing protein [Patescibacteria group bacterium]